jgi:hypothetical protein
VAKEVGRVVVLVPCVPPCQHMLIHAVDQGSVEIEQERKKPAGMRMAANGTPSS